MDTRSILNALDRKRSRRTLTLLAAAVVPLLATGARADTFTWTNANANGNWQEAGNWTNLTGTLEFPGTQTDTDGIPDGVFPAESSDAARLRDDAPDLAQFINITALGQGTRTLNQTATGNRSYTFQGSAYTAYDNNILHTGSNTLTFNTGVQVRDNDGALSLTMNTASATAGSPLVLFNNPIVNSAGGAATYVRFTAIGNHATGTSSVLLNANNTQTRLGVTDNAEIILGSATAGGVVDGGGEYSVTMSDSGNFVGATKIISTRVDTTLPGSINIVGNALFRINQATVGDRTLTFRRMGDLGSAAVTLGAAVGGGSGNFTLKLTDPRFAATVTTTATTTLELSAGEQRFIGPTLGDDGLVAGTGKLRISSTDTGNGPISRLNFDSTNTHTGGTTITSTGYLRIRSAADANGAKLGTGDVTVQGGDSAPEGGGDLELQNTTANVIDNNAALRLSSGANVNISTGITEQVAALFFNGIEQVTGTWGSVGGSATNQSSFFSGNGVINVVPIPEPSSLAVLGLGAFLATRRRVRRTHAEVC